MISPYYIQYPDDEGNFNNKEEPSVWFKKMYGVTTTWQIIFNDKSTFFRTEGIKSNVSRINGLQPYGMPNLSGYFRGGDTTIGVFTESSGVFQSSNNISSKYKIYMGSFRSDIVYPFPYTNVDISTNRQIKEYTNDLVVNNYQIRIYKLLTINGKKVSDIIGA